MAIGALCCFFFGWSYFAVDDNDNDPDDADSINITPLSIILIADI